jgi:hypothetical protein
MSNSRRYEILLPLRFNDGQPVPWELVGETLLELRRRFSAVSWETQTIRGMWEHEGTEFQDDLVRVFVDVPDLPEHRQFFADLKGHLKSRFQQLDIWMTTYPIDVVLSVTRRVFGTQRNLISFRSRCEFGIDSYECICCGTPDCSDSIGQRAL